MEKLLLNTSTEFSNILPSGRKDSKIEIGLGLLKQDFKMLSFCKKHKPDMLIGTSVSISHVGKILGIPSININEDDADVVPLYSKLAYPWADVILSPKSCNNGKWEEKTIKYEGYHELAYLHPSNFKPDKKIVSKYLSSNSPFSLLRFAKLKAHHDKGIKGISFEIAERLISILSKHTKVFISSERQLEPELEKYRIKIDPVDMHHVLAFAELFIGDSQTMAAEAAVLGTPFIRFNDFVDRIGYLDELENKYKLGYGIKSNNPDKLFELTKELIVLKGRKDVFQHRKQKMLSEKINVASYLTWFIENYPRSTEIMEKRPEYQYTFK